MERFDLTPFTAFCTENNLPLPESAVPHLKLFGALLLEWNEKINLTAITNPEEIVFKHFIDCAALLKFLKLKPGNRLIDVGTGAGFPGMILKILVPKADITLLDGHAKRFVFLQDFMEKSGVCCTLLHARAELAAQQPHLREQFDFATARAVAALPTLLEYCLPFVKCGGCFAAMKGPGLKEEFPAAAHALQALGGSAQPPFVYLLPDGSERTVVQVKKISQTPPKYPRASAKISKQPL